MRPDREHSDGDAEEDVVNEESRLVPGPERRHDVDEFVPDGLDDESNVDPEPDPPAELAAVDTRNDLP